MTVTILSSRFESPVLEDTSPLVYKLCKPILPSAEHRSAKDKLPRDLHAACSLAFRSYFLSKEEMYTLCFVCHEWKHIIFSTILAQQSLLVTDSACEKHIVPHRMERPERISSILHRCRSRYPQVPQITAVVLATKVQLQRFHTKEYIRCIFNYAAKIDKSVHALSSGDELSVAKLEYLKQFETIYVDQDTIMMQHTLQASLAAAGAVCMAIDKVLDPLQAIQNAFCVVRPPGHHAESNAAKGFCFFNNVGIGAYHALDLYCLKKIVIIDFDIHHGNGLENRLRHDDRVRYISIHEESLYPYSGVGEQNTAQICNFPIPAKTSSRAYRKLITKHIVPCIVSFQPEFILLASGFDAHAKDPLAHVCLNSEDYYWMTAQFIDIAWRHCNGRIVSVLEGGYHILSLADSADQHFQALVHGSYRPKNISAQT